MDNTVSDTAACVLQTSVRFLTADQNKQITSADGTRILAFPDGIVCLDFKESRIAGELAPIAFNDSDYTTVMKSVSHLQDVVAKRCQMANSFQAALSSAMSTRQHHSIPLTPEITPDSYFPARLHHSASESDLETVRHRLRSSGGRLPADGTEVRQETLVVAVETFDAIVEHEETLLLTDLLFKAAHRWSRHDSALAAVIAWSICEKVLFSVWKKHIDNQRSQFPDRFNAERKKLLTERLNAETLIEFQELLDILPSNSYDRLNSIRKARNHWMHRLSKVSDKEGNSAVALAQDLIQYAYGINLQISMTRSMTW